MLKFKPKQRKDVHVGFYVLPELKQRIEVAAASHDLPVSEYLRQIVEFFLASDFSFTEDFQKNENSETEETS